MRKYMALLMAGLMSVLALAGCTPNSGNSQSEDGDKLKIVATIFPEYDWVREIMGEKISEADVKLLMDNGADLHNYNPTFQDMAMISDCDIFIYVGGESDEWVDDVLKTCDNKDMIVINVLETLGDRVREEEIVEGMEAEHEDADEGVNSDEESEGNSANANSHESGDEDVEQDEHVWLSLKNASIACDRIAEALETADPENKEIYATNLENYKAKLSELDSKYQAAVDEAECKTILFGDRFPFRYMTEDYGLDYYAAFVGCSTEVEASFDTIIFLANKVDELDLNVILTTEGVEHKIAQTVRDNTKSKDQQILALDSMQTVSSSDINSGKTYLSIMSDNLEVLKEALK